MKGLMNWYRFYFKQVNIHEYTVYSNFDKFSLILENISLILTRH